MNGGCTHRRASSTFFQCKPEGEQRGSPEKERGGIWRHRQPDSLKDRNCVQQNNRPHRHRFAVKYSREKKRNQARPQREQRAEKTHAEFVRAEQRRPGPDRDGDTRPVVEVSQVESLRPERVMGFIGRKLGFRAVNPAQEGASREEKKKPVSRSHAAAC